MLNNKLLLFGVLMLQMCMVATSKNAISAFQQTCHEMPYDACSAISWKRAQMPSLVPALPNAEFQRLFGPLIDSECSRYVRFLLCMTYAPPCGGNSTQTLCRDSCESVQRDCDRALRIRNLTWPSELACEKFPHKRSSCINKKALKKVSKHSKGGLLYY